MQICTDNQRTSSLVKLIVVALGRVRGGQPATCPCARSPLGKHPLSFSFYSSSLTCLPPPHKTLGTFLGPEGHRTKVTRGQMRYGVDSQLSVLASRPVTCHCSCGISKCSVCSLLQSHLIEPPSQVYGLGTVAQPHKNAGL